MNSQNIDNEVTPMDIPSHIIVMQDPAEEAEASIPTENVREGPNENLYVTFAVRRKVAKRTPPWDLTLGELHLMSPSQAEDIRVAVAS